MSVRFAVAAICLIAMASHASLAAAPASGPAAAASQPVQWSAQASDGKAVTVPAADRPTLMAFVRMDQPQSRQALQSLHSAVADNSVQVVVIVSGQSASIQGEALTADGERWPVVLDEDYQASGAINVHVWPTVVVVGADGARLGHVAGMPKSFAADLEAYLALAAGTIDRAELQRRLDSRQVVGDTPEQSAARRLQVAERLLAHGELAQAKVELEQAMQLDPDSPAARLLLARAMIMSDQPAEAMKWLDQVPAGAAPAWQSALLRAKALVALEKWDQARSLVPEAMKLNPDPAEAHYLAGRVAEHDQDWSAAAREYRQAFESIRAGRQASRP